MVAMDTGFHAEGRATFFYDICEAYARDLRYKGILSEPTGPISQHIKTKKLGFEQLHTIHYRDFEFKGRKVFTGIQHDGAMLVRKVLKYE